MSFVKFDFLNWQPDREVYDNAGLTVADNLIHDADGYKDVEQQTAGAFSTTSPLNAGFIEIRDVRLRPFGLSGDLCVADIYADTTTTAALRIGVHGANAFTQASMATLASVGAARIISFSTAEFGQEVVIAAQAEASLLAGGTTTYALGGTFAYTLTAV
jgi:hypothetical protein